MEEELGPMSTHDDATSPVNKGYRVVLSVSLVNPQGFTEREIQCIKPIPNDDGEHDHMCNLFADEMCDAVAIAQRLGARLSPSLSGTISTARAKIPGAVYGARAA